MQGSKFIYFRKQSTSARREHTSGEFYFVVIRFPVLSFLEFLIHLTFLYAGVKVIHVLSRYMYTCIWSCLAFQLSLGLSLNLYLLEMKYRTGP